MDIADINRIALGENEVLWVTIDRGNMPGKLFEQHAEKIRDTLQLYFLSNKIIVTSSDVKFTVIKEEDHAPIST
jgi:hypothetical protein